MIAVSFRVDAFKSVASMWQSFKTAITSTMEEFVLSKMSSSRHTHPWINTRILQATRRKQGGGGAQESKSKQNENRLGPLQTYSVVIPKEDKDSSQTAHGGRCQLRHES